MNQRIMVRLIVVAMAMVMTVGMGLTVFAEDSGGAGDSSGGSVSGGSILETPKGTTAPSVPTAEQVAEEAAKIIMETIAQEEALPVSAFIAPVPEVVASSLPAGIYNISDIKTTQGFVAAVNKIAMANPEPTVTVYASKPIAFNNDSLAAVANCGKVFTYVFNYDGHTYSVTIPAGASIDGVIGRGRFEGPLYLGYVFGTTRIVK